MYNFYAKITFIPHTHQIRIMNKNETLQNFHKFALYLCGENRRKI